MVTRAEKHLAEATAAVSKKAHELARRSLQMTKQKSTKEHVAFAVKVRNMYTARVLLAEAKKQQRQRGGNQLYKKVAVSHIGETGSVEHHLDFRPATYVAFPFAVKNGPGMSVDNVHMQFETINAADKKSGLVTPAKHLLAIARSNEAQSKKATGPAPSPRATYIAAEFSKRMKTRLNAPKFKLAASGLSKNNLNKDKGNRTLVSQLTGLARLLGADPVKKVVKMLAGANETKKKNNAKKKTKKSRKP